ncbi:MAG: hypothetical protein ABW170_04740 [Candidatus Thiodiazotropha sp. L084R]
MRSKVVLYIATLLVALLLSSAHAQMSQTVPAEEDLSLNKSLVIDPPKSTSIENDHRNNVEKLNNSESISSEHDLSKGVPYRKDPVISGDTLTRVLAAIVIAIIIIIAVVYALKKFLFARDYLTIKDNRMQLLDIKRLSPRLTLFMVRVDDKTMVLAQSGDRLLTLDPAGSFELQSENLNDQE